MRGTLFHTINIMRIKTLQHRLNTKKWKKSKVLWNDYKADKNFLHHHNYQSFPALEEEYKRIYFIDNLKLYLKIFLTIIIVGVLNWLIYQIGDWWFWLGFFIWLFMLSIIPFYIFCYIQINRLLWKSSPPRHKIYTLKLFPTDCVEIKKKIFFH